MRLVPITALNGAMSVTRVTLPGTLTSGSPTVSGVADTSQLAGAVGVKGTGIPSGTYVLSIDSPGQVTLTQNATASGSQSLTWQIEPVSLAEAKLHARVGHSEDDALIASLIAAARYHCEKELKSAILRQQWTLYLDSFPVAGGYYNPAVRQIWSSLGGMPSGLAPLPGFVPNSTGIIDIPLPPLVSIDSVKYYDTGGTLQTIDPSLYNASLGVQGRIQPAYGKVWPLARPTIDAVQIAFTAGRGATSDDVEDNIKAAMKLMIGHWYENREAVVVGTINSRLADTVDALLAPSDPGIYA